MPSQPDRLLPIDRRVTTADAYLGGPKFLILASLLAIYDIIAAVRLFRTAFGLAGRYHDFAYLWLMGKAYLLGISPYTDEYLRLGHTIADLSGLSDKPYGAYYPPSWSLITMGFGSLSFYNAGVLWLCLSLLMAIVAPILIFLLLPRGYLRILLLLITFAYIFSLSGTKFNFILGQTSVLIMFGLAVLVYGIAIDRRIWRVIGACIVMLKPNVGIIIVLPLLYLDYKSVIYAGIISVLACVPAFIDHSPVVVLHDFAQSLATYENYPVGMIQAQTGVALLVYLATGWKISAIAISVAGALVALLAVALYHRHVDRTGNMWSAFLVITASLVTVFVRFHMHDMTLIALIIMPLALSAGKMIPKLIALVPLLVLLRPEAVAVRLHFFSEGAAVKWTNFLGANLLTSICMTIVAVGVALCLLDLRASRDEAARVAAGVR